MKIIAVMVIWFGTGQYSRFDTERYDSMAECEAARMVIITTYQNPVWEGAIPQGNVRCLEVDVPE